MLADRYAGIVLDVDGVLRLADQPIDGAGAALGALRARGRGVALVTNNASLTPAQVAAELTAMGIAVEPAEVLTSSLAAAAMLDPGDRCLLIGMTGLRSALEERGCTLVEDPHDAQAVVVGWDRGLTWDALRRATLALARGARFVGTNADVTYPSPEGPWPGNGATLAALTAASGRQPEIAGKPHAPLFELAAARLPAGPLLMVGDRPETDLAGASALGWDTALVLSGITSAEAAGALRPPPTHVLRSVCDLLE
jgi:glycerol-1-phosphatase